MNHPVEVFLLLVLGHFIADRPLQPAWMGYWKNRRTWSWRRVVALVAHGGCHGVMVGLITQSWWLGVAEMLAHATCDCLKTERWIGLKTDQCLHLLCKLVWVWLLFV